VDPSIPSEPLSPDTNCFILTEPTHFSLKLQRFFAKAWLPLPLQGVAVQNKGEAEESFNMSQSQR